MSRRHRTVFFHPAPLAGLLATIRTPCAPSPACIPKTTGLLRTYQTATVLQHCQQGVLDSLLYGVSPDTSGAHKASQIRPLHLGNPRPPAATPFGFPLCRHRPVAVAAAIPPQFARDDALVPAKPLGNLHLHFSHSAHVGYDLTFVRGNTTCHPRGLLSNGTFLKTPIQTSPRCFHQGQFFRRLRFSSESAGRTTLAKRTRC